MFRRLSLMHEEIGAKLLKSGNCLGVLATGLCESETVRAILSQLLGKNSSSQKRITPLVILLSSSQEDEGTVGSTTIITGETLSDARGKVYASGGVVQVTSRVLLSDLLVRRLDPALIDLILIRNAHTVASDSGNEAFIARVFRESNGRGSLIALTEKPHAISKQVDSFVSVFCLSEVLVFPRFHEVAKLHLDEQVLEMDQHESPLSIRQVEIQNLLLSVVEASLTEIKRFGIDNSNAIDLMQNSNELFLLRKKLEPVWMKLSWNARQIVIDLSVIRKLLVSLVKYDSVSFLSILTEHHRMSSRTSPWWFSEAALQLFKLAKDRVGAGDEIEAMNDWTILTDLAHESESQVQMVKKPKTIEQERIKIIVVTADELSAKQFTAFINEGSKKCLLESLLRSEIDQTKAIQFAIDSLPLDTSFTSSDFLVVPSLEKPDILLSQISCFIPSVIVLTSPSLTAVRVIEIFQFLNRNNPSSITLRVHVFTHPTSAVELSFQALMDRENKAFDDIIRARKIVTFHSRDELFHASQRNRSIANASSRKGGSRRQPNVAKVSDLLQQRVLVDVRELRSPLPFVLYKKSLEIVPSTLAIGDYVLSRDIAIERKSVTGNDLQQSLNSGRLYKQLVNMTYAFAWPILLLEFTTGRSFQLQSTDSLTGEINPSSLIAQIIAIIMHFPTVRLLWSPSFTFTANVFSRLKIGREQPRSENPVKESCNSSRAVEFLKACPGITAANLPIVLKRVCSVKQLIDLKDDEIISILGKRDGNLFLKFINYQF